MSQLYNKYLKLNSAAKASLWFMICSILQKGFAFIAIPIYTRLLTTTEYGCFSVYNAWYQLLLVFATLCMSSEYLVIGILKHNIDAKKMLGLLQGCCSITCVSFFLFILLIYTFFFRKISLNLFYLEIMFVQIFFASPMLLLTRKQQYEYKYKLIVVLSLSMSALTVVVSLLMIKIWPNKSDSLILGAAIVQILFGICVYIYNFIEAGCFYNGKIWKEGILFCIPLIPHNLAYFVLNSADRVMIDRMCSTSDAGIYSLAGNISIAIGIITNALGASLNPWVLKRLKEKEYNKIAVILNKIVLFLGILMIIAVFVAPEILQIIASKDYMDAKWVMPPIMLGAFFLFIASVPCLVSLFHERKKTIAFASCAAAVVNIFLNWLFIPIWGYYAAAYTTMISYAVFAIFHFIMAKRLAIIYKYEQSPFNCSFIILLSVIISFICFITMLLYDYPIVRYLIVLAGVIIIYLKKQKIINILIQIKADK